MGIRPGFFFVAALACALIKGWFSLRLACDKRIPFGLILESVKEVSQFVLACLVRSNCIASYWQYSSGIARIESRNLNGKTHFDYSGGIYLAASQKIYHADLR
jgi:hypothetical protein